MEFIILLNSSELKTTILDSPEHSKYEMVIDSKPDDQYVVFHVTGLQLDAGQSYVPFFDAQDTESVPNVPLSGFGLYHRGTNDSGGFIALNAFTVNFGDYLYDTYLPFEAIINEKIKKIQKAKGKKAKDDYNDDEEYVDNNF